MQSINLNGNWQVSSTPLSLTGDAGYKEVTSTSREWMPAQVPGEIHLDLMRAGKMDDPEISDNARRSRWPEEHAWWYRMTFTVPDDFRALERQLLILDGVDLCGQVFLNGTLLGTTDNAFVEHQFSTKRALRDGENELVVRVTCGTELIGEMEEGQKYEGIYDIRSFRSRRLLRKPQYVYGWDWNDPLPNIGLWRGVSLEGRNGAVITDFRLDTLIEGGQVSLVGEAVLENLHPWIERECALEITLIPPEGKPLVCRIDRRLPMGRSAVPLRLEVPDAQLWWPNGFGEQPLYGMTARVLHDGAECDRREQTIGLRTVEIDRAALADGTRFRIIVNGQPVFCRGGNWAPADMIPARIPRERYEALVAEAKNAGFTMFRMNGIGLYEDDAFFGACDRAGILLWQDFMFACAEYPDHEPQFQEAIRTEAETVVRRLRHHPSIALWSGGNECIWGITAWLNSDLSDLDALGGIRMYGQVLPDVIHRLDPLRAYWPCSPYGGDLPNDEHHGNCHWWADYMSGDFDKRTRLDLADTCRARFVSEYGIIGPPLEDSVREYLRPDEQTRDSLVWKIHTNTFEAGSVDAAIRTYYGEPNGLALSEYLLYGQMFQAMAHGHAMEAMRFRKDDPEAECWGALIWSYNDCWGEMGWSVIDHYLRRKASYYWLRRACSPMKIISRPRGDSLVTRIVNDTLQSREGEVQHGWFRLDGTDRRLTTRQAAIPANGMVEIARENIPDDLSPREWLYGAVLRGEGVEDQALWLLAPVRELALPEPQLSVIQQGNLLEISSPVFCHGVHYYDGGHEVLSDNYFDLLPGITRTVTVVDEMPDLRVVLPVAIIKK
ncbi:MAG: glycoside hydrolase family 2 protein [Armatimonadota bacterium]